MLNFNYINEEVLRFKKSLSDLKNTTIVSYCNNVKLFFKYLITIEKDILDVEKKDVLDYIAKMKIDGLSPSQINCRFAAIKKYYEYLLDCEQFDENRYIKLFNRIKLPKIIAKKQEVYLKDMADIIIDIFMKEKSTANFTTLVNLLFLVILKFTGGRRNEVATLKVEDIDFNLKCIHFYNTKNNISRHIQVPDKILEMIKKYLIEREKNIKSDTTNLFLNKHGKPTNVDSISANIIMVAKNMAFR